MTKAISNEKAYEIANKIGLDLNDFKESCFATNDEEDDLWGFFSEEERSEAIERNRNYWRIALIEILVG